MRLLILLGIQSAHRVTAEFESSGPFVALTVSLTLHVYTVSHQHAAPSPPRPP